MKEWKKDIVLIVVVLVVSLLLRYWLLPVLGYSLANVEGNSMQPTLSSGDLLIVRDSSPNLIKVGDIIVYKVSTDILIVHRVVVVIDDEKIITKGDNNGSPDPPIERSQIKGKVTLVIPRFRLIRIYIIPVLLVLLGVTWCEYYLRNISSKTRRRG